VDVRSRRQVTGAPYPRHRRIEKRIDLVEMSDEVGVAATVANGATETVVFGDLESIPVELVAQFRGAGSTDIAVLERRHAQVQGHSALDFRISFTPLDHTKGKSMWFVRAIDDDTSLVMLQTIAFPPLGSPEVIAARGDSPYHICGFRLNRGLWQPPGQNACSREGRSTAPAT
jgi:hypothetical protein